MVLEETGASWSTAQDVVVHKPTVGVDSWA